MSALVFRQRAEIYVRDDFDPAATVTLENYGGPVGGARLPPGEFVRCQLHAGNRRCPNMFGRGALVRIRLKSPDSKGRATVEAAVGADCIDRYFPQDSQIHRDLRELDLAIDLDELRVRLQAQLTDIHYIDRLDEAHALAVRCVERFDETSAAMPDQIRTRLKAFAKQRSGRVTLLIEYEDEDSNGKKITRQMPAQGEAILGLAIWRTGRRRAIFDEFTRIRKAFADESNTEELEIIRSRVVVLESAEALKREIDTWNRDLDAFTAFGNLKNVCLLSRDDSLQRTVARWALTVNGKQSGAWEIEALVRSLREELSARFNGQKVRISDG